MRLADLSLSGREMGFWRKTRGRGLAPEGKDWKCACNIHFTCDRDVIASEYS